MEIKKQTFEQLAILEKVIAMTWEIKALEGFVPEDVIEQMYNKVYAILNQSQPRSHRKEPAERAEELGFWIEDISIRIMLNQYVVANIGTSPAQEKRSLKGQDRIVDVYEPSNELDYLIKTFFDKQST